MIRIIPPLTMASLALILTACGGSEKEDTGAGADTDATDTNATDTNATDTSAETGLPTDTADTASDVERTDVTFAMSGQYTDTTLTLTQITPSDKGFIFEESPVISRSVTDASMTIGIPTPDKEDLVPVDGFEELAIAMLLPALSDGETYVGVAEQWPAYVVGKIPAKLEDIGLTEGWNMMVYAFDSDETPFSIQALSEINMNTNLYPNNSITVGGTYAGNFDVEDLRISTVSFAEFEGGSVSSPLVDQSMSDPWTVEISSAPDADHFITDKGSGLTVAGAMVVSYIDNDGNDSFSLSADTIDGQTCTRNRGGQLVSLMYYPGFDSLELSLAWVMNGMTTGWSAVKIDELKGSEDGESATVEGKNLLDLVLGGDCAS